MGYNLNFDRMYSIRDMTIMSDPMDIYQMPWHGIMCMHVCACMHRDGSEHAKNSIVVIVGAESDHLEKGQIS